MPSRSPTIALLALLLCTAGASAQRGAHSAADSVAVRDAFAKLVRAFNDRDADAVMRRFAPEVVLVYPNRLDGRFDQIERDFRARFAQPASGRVTAEVEAMHLSGDIAALQLLWTATAVRRGGAVQSSSERDLEIWMRDASGDWKLRRGLSFPVVSRPPAPHD